MSMATATHTSDFVIQGPVLARGNNVLEAIHALYFLPENFRLIFTGNSSVDQSFYKEAQSLVDRDELHGRVEFKAKTAPSNAIVVDEKSGDSPEALASAILKAARGRH